MFHLQQNFDSSEYLATFSAINQSLSPLQSRHSDYYSGNLPVSPMLLIGREAEVRAIKTLLLAPEVRLLTLTGVAGIGKTRLGLQVARELSNQFKHGVFFVGVAPVRDPALLIPVIAGTLGLKDAGSQPLIETLQAYLHDKQLLLLIDNFEQVVHAASILSSLLTDAPNLKILVTSRIALGVYGEQEFEVPPLALPDPRQLAPVEALSQYEAVAMFTQRARLVRPNFSLTKENAATIAEICIRLDGLPLAIELAAALLRVLNPAMLRARLSAHSGACLKLLTRGARDLPPRQQTLRNALDWSYQLLSSGEQALFRSLGVFVGGCALEAVEEVCEPALEPALPVFEGLAALVTKSMLRYDGSTRSESRFWLLETLREYALEQLAVHAEEQVLRQRHAEHYLKMAEIAEVKLRGSDQAEWLDRIETDHNNFRAALRWLLEQGEIEKAARLSSGLALFWWVRGYLSEGQQWLKIVLGQAELPEVINNPKALPDAARLKALAWLALLMRVQSDEAWAKALQEESLALQAKVSDSRLVAFSLWSLAFHTRYFNPLSYLQQSLALFREIGDKWGIGQVLERLGVIMLFSHKYELARPMLEESLELTRSIGNKLGTAMVLNGLGYLANFQANYHQAIPLLEESLALLCEIKCGPLEAWASNGLGWAALNQGKYDEARRYFEQRLTIHQELGERYLIAITLNNLGLVEIYCDNYLVAKDFFEKSLKMFIELKNRDDISLPLWGLAEVARAQGQLKRAARLLGAAEAVRQACEEPMTAVYTSHYERVISAVCAELSNAAFLQAKAEGHHLTPEQAFSPEEQEEPLQSWALPVSARPTGPLASPESPDQASNKYFKQLTPREIDVLKLIAMGLSNGEVAKQLALSPRTVNVHLTSIYIKLRVKSRTAASRYALKHKLIE